MKKSVFNCSVLARGVDPKLLKQHTLLNLLFSVSDPGAPSNS